LRLVFTIIGDFGVLGGLILLGRLVLNWDLLADFLRKEELNGVLNELRVLLHEVFDFVLFHILDSVVLKVKGNASAAAKCVTAGVLGNKELGVCGRGPHVLLIVIALRSNYNLVSNKESRVKADTELPDKRKTISLSYCLEEGSSTTLGDSTEVLDKLGLCHADASVSDGDGLSFEVKVDHDLKLGN
jgi:hypothetical protein